MIERTRDPAIPARFSVLSGLAPLDFSAVDLENVVCLAGERGCFLFEGKGAGEYEAHVMLSPEGRGRWGFRAAAQAVAEMKALGAARLSARILAPHVGVFARKAGFQPKSDGIYEWSVECPQQ